MNKFTCGHCGGRIAVTRRNMGKLVVCPECGKTTHPLAVEILAAAKEGPSVRSGSAEPIERKCENCGRVIGRLEKPELWKTHVVCGGCYPLLARTPVEASGEPTPATKPKRGSTSAAKRTAKAAEALPAERGILALPDQLSAGGSNLPTLVAERMGKAIVSAAAKPIQVQVNRAAAAGSRLIPIPARGRLVVLLIAIFIGGCALYGALSLLRDMMGILTTISLVLVAAAIGLAAARICVYYVGQWIPQKWIPKRWRREGEETGIVVAESEDK